MKLIPLTHGKVAIVDDADYARLCAHKWYCVRSRPGRPVYAVRTGGVGEPKHVRMHREIMQPADGVFIDHKNRDTLDNTRGNLREANHSQNGANRGKTRANTSGFKGVTLCSYTGRWKAQIRVFGVNKHLGRFDTPQLAAKAYEVAAIVHGEFASV